MTGLRSHVLRAGATCLAILVVPLCGAVHAQQTKKNPPVIVATAGGAVVSPDSALHRFDHDDWHFAPARIEGNVVYLGGIVAGALRDDRLPLDSLRLEESYRRAWRQIRATLEAAGSSTADIVEMTTFHVFDSTTVTQLTKQQQIDAFRRVKDEFVPAPYPAWTGIGVATLFASRGALVEIRVIAHRRTCVVPKCG